MGVPTSAIYVFTRDKLRRAGVESSFADDLDAALRAWAAGQGRHCAVLAREPGRAMAALNWREEDYDAAVWDFHRQCELFAVAWAPASPIGG